MFDVDYGFKLVIFKINIDEDWVGIVCENFIW